MGNRESTSTSKSYNSQLNSSAISSTNTDILYSLRQKNPERLIFSHLNINSLRNKFDFLVPLVKDRIDILMLSETKLDVSFPETQFQMEGFF